MISVLWFFDNVRVSFRKTLRAFFYGVLFVTVFTGFYVQNGASVFSNVPNIVNKSNPEILGAQIENPNYDEIYDQVSASAVYAVDIPSGKVLLDVNSSDRYAPASTTKLMTALVALELYELEEEVFVPEFCTQIEGLKAGFYSNDLYKVEDLIYSMLVNSSADAACTLAISKTPYADFVLRMNLKARDLGMNSTHFTNPVGLDSDGLGNYSTAQDLYKLAAEARKNQIIKESVGTKDLEVSSVAGNKTYMRNTNELLWTLPGTVGMKTGTTVQAGEVLIYEYKQNSTNVMIIVLRSWDRFNDTAKVLEWLKQNYSWVS